ncbi:MAG: IS21 family transposase [Deltaproteobacteria bacterium]|nr:IS21 family transposase [Deltaproteobacteria bacterium]
MLRMNQVHVIRHKVLVEGQSQRQTAEDMGVSRNTVKKYIHQSEPILQQKVKKRRKVFDRVKPRMDELIEEWKHRTTRKQRLTGRRLHRQLIDEGYQVGQTLVREYVRERKRETSEVYIPLVHYPGDEAQIDFFEVTVDLAGERCKRLMFVMRLMYSGRDFAWLYERCDQPSFFDGHVRAFLHFGGIPARCVYDNLSPAVKRVLFPGRDLTERFTALVSHYLFEPCFTRPYTGHDKGGIEARGKTIRYQHLVPIPRGADLEEISGKLLQSLDEQADRKKDKHGHTVTERFEEERHLFRELPPYPFEPRLMVPLQANRQSLVTYDQATYSLPSHWKQLDVTAYVGPIDIRFICRDEITVRRRVMPKEKQIQYTDYLSELSRKPQAVRQVAPELLKELGEPFNELWRLLEDSHGGKEAGRIFAKVLTAVVKHGQQEVGQAIGKALHAGQQHLLALGDLIRRPLPKEIEVPQSLKSYVVESTSAADFDLLLEQEVPQ